MVNPLDYARTVKAIGNDMVGPQTRVKEKSSNPVQDIAGAKLKEFLPPAAVMVVTVASTTTEGKHLIEIEMKKIGKACDLMTELEITKRKVISLQVTFLYLVL